jgi:hypothetical protein
VPYAPTQSARTRDAEVAKATFSEPANQGKLTSAIAAECIRHERMAIRMAVEAMKPHERMPPVEVWQRVLDLIDARNQ